MADANLWRLSPRPDRGAAKTFYGEVLGLGLVEDAVEALVFDGNGTMLRVAKVVALAPAGHPVLGWIVADLEGTMGLLTEKGVDFAHFPGLTDPQTRVWRSERGDKIAWFRDPDGNVLSLMQFA